MDDVKQKIVGLFAKLPQNYAQRSAAMMAIDQAFHMEMASQIQASLKEEIRRRPSDTYEDKKQLSKWVNGELRRFGLAIRGNIKEEDANGMVAEKIYPAILAVDPGHHAAIGRFRILCKPDSIKPKFPVSTPSVLELLDHFSVIADDPDRRRTGKWTDGISGRGENIR